MVELSDRRCDKRVARYRFHSEPGLDVPPASRQWMHPNGKESSNYGRRALPAWCDRCHNRCFGHELERRLAPSAATWRSRVDRVRLARFGAGIAHAGLNCLLAQHYRTSRISRQSNDRFWLNRVRNAARLRHQDINLAQHHHNLFGLVSLPRHDGPPQ